MSGEWEKKVLFNGNNNTTVEGTLVGSPQQQVAYIHSCGVCLNEPKQMIAQPLIEDYNDRRNYYGPFSV